MLINTSEASICRNSNEEPKNQSSEPKKGPSNPNSWQRNNKPEQGPPDLDQVLKDLQKKLKGLFGGNKPGSGSNRGNDNRGWGGRGGASTGGGGNNTTIGRPDLLSAMKPFWGLIALVLALGYVISGVYIVQPAERAVITRFGKYDRTEVPGLHWLPRLIDQEEKVNVERRETSRHQGAMLTKDENIVFVDIAVQYRINNAKDFLFNVARPIRTLGEATESALRQVIGQSDLDYVLTLGRASVASSIKSQLIDTVQNYGMGIEIYDVNMQPAKVPEEVRAAFDDVIKAREEHESLVYTAKAYANDILPKAQGKVDRMLEEANGYREEMRLIAEGAKQRFNLVLPEYQKAPQVTRTRLMLETMEQVFSNTNKVMIDNKDKGATPLLYLPVDKLIGADLKKMGETVDLTSLSTLAPAESNATPASANSNKATSNMTSGYYREDTLPSGKSNGLRYSKDRNDSYKADKG